MYIAHFIQELQLKVLNIKSRIQVMKVIIKKKIYIYNIDKIQTAVFAGIQNT